MELLLASIAMQLLSKLIPIIEEKTKTGEYSVDEQAQTRAEYVALRQAGDSAFDGPEWQVSTKPIVSE